MGLTNVVLGMIYKLPLPVEAKKAIGTIALEEKWRPEQVYMSGILTGVIWLFLGLSGLVKRLARITPVVVVRGIQFGLMLILLKQAILLMKTSALLSLTSIALIVLLMRNRFLPSAIAVFCLGLALAIASAPELELRIGFYLPHLSIPSPSTISLGLLSAVIAQIVLTFSNAILATCLAINERFPERKIDERSLAINMGVMNTVLPLIGGIPMCHGAGGFASQYFFGGRTGGAMMMEGACELFLALFLSGSVVEVFGAFPPSIIGAMLLFASLELGKFIKKVRRSDFALILLVGVVSLIANLALGFLAGLLLSLVLRYSKEEIR